MITRGKVGGKTEKGNVSKDFEQYFFFLLKFLFPEIFCDGEI